MTGDLNATFGHRPFIKNRREASLRLSLPHRGRGTAPAVDRVLSYNVDLRRFLFHLYRLLETISLALFHTARTLSGSLCSPPSPRGEGFVSGIAVSPFRSPLSE